MISLITKPPISLSDEKKKTKVIDSEVNPVWNEVARTSHSWTDECSNMFTLIAERLYSDDVSPLWMALISVALSCLRCWSSTWRERRWTLPPALMWLWKTTRLLAKISKCGSRVRVCATRRRVMKEKMLALPPSSLHSRDLLLLNEVSLASVGVTFSKS